MRIVPFWKIELLFALAWILFRVIAAVVKRKFDIKRELLMLLMYVNLAVLIRLIYFPLDMLTDLLIRYRFFEMPKINLVPFVHLLEYNYAGNAFINVAGNVLMFVPTGIIVPILYKKFDSFPMTVMAGFLLSLAIELSQLFTPDRVTDVDDLIMNTLGAAIGFGIYYLVKRIKNRNGKEASHGTDPK